MEKLSLRGRWTLVTGASSGLGVELARLVAAEHGGNVVLVARRRDRLEALAKELREAHKVEVHCVGADMTRREDVDRAFEEATAEGRALCAMVLNAGVTYFGRALEQSYEDLLALVQTNVLSNLRFVQRFAPYAQAQQPDAAVMLVSSLAGFSPMPWQAAYGGSKAFLSNFGQALVEELRGKSPSVTVFAPGGIATEMLDTSGIGRKFKAGDLGIMAADKCARIALEGMLRRRALVVPGVLNKVSTVAMRLAPRQFVAGRISALYREALPK